MTRPVVRVLLLVALAGFLGCDKGPENKIYDAKPGMKPPTVGPKMPTGEGGDGKGEPGIE
jgi:hypothetical protein